MYHVSCKSIVRLDEVTSNGPGGIWKAEVVLGSNRISGLPCLVVMYVSLEQSLFSTKTLLRAD